MSASVESQHSVALRQNVITVDPSQPNGAFNVQHGAMFVSVVLPVHNGERYLAETIESVLAQTHRAFELIIVDDGSTDGTARIAFDYAKESSCVKVLWQRRQGSAVARNVGLAVARGEWVACLDHDDVMLPHRLERQLVFIRAHPDVKAFGAIARYIDEKGRAYGYTIPAPVATREQLDRYLGTGKAIGLNHPSVMMHRKTVLDLGGYRNLVVAQDIDLWLRLADAGHLVLQQHEVLMKYRMHSQSVTIRNVHRSAVMSEYVLVCSRARRMGAVEPSVEQFTQNMATQPWWRRWSGGRRRLGWAMYRRAGTALINRQWLAGVRDLATAFCLRPLYVISRLGQQLLKGANP